MLIIFCFLMSTTLLIDHIHSIPASKNDSTGPADRFQVQPDEISDSSSAEPPNQPEIVSITSDIANSDTQEPVTKNDPQNVEEKNEVEKLAFEMFKRKCEHLQDILRQNKTKPNANRPTSNQHQSRPFYITPKPLYKPIYPTTSKPNGFYITAQPSTTRKPIVHVQTPPPIKYIRLEPVILQKTILSDGRTVYYWHRSLPTAVEYPSKFSEEAQHTENIKNEFVPTYGYVPQNINIPPPPSVPIMTSNSYYYPTVNQSRNTGGADKNTVEVTTESTTTTTTEESSGYGFGSFLPFYSMNKAEPAPSTTTQPTTTSPPPPSTNKVIKDDLVYAQQLKFIVPVPYDGTQERLPVQAPWSFDPYAYYPKSLQPRTVDVRVPYSPTFHMIRAVAVPKLNTNENERIDQTDNSAEQIVYP
ncbi:uncharacterized protein [Leptinotarsa decemlineata]|uniref:uncharacterized protein n=1 Tax=Leptinotarsa decemlineata TaxID=7539 RepID=UPI003D30AD26